MGKILIGNNKSKVKYLKDLFVKHGFHDYSERAGLNYKAFFFKKLRVINENYFSIADDYIASSGTILYKKDLGQKALRNIFLDYNKGIKHIRANAYGNYCLVIKSDEYLYVFTDCNSIYNIYYYHDDDDWMISNTYYHLAEVKNEMVTNDVEIIEYSFQYATLGNTTPFRGIYKLMEYEYIKIDLVRDIFTVNTLKSPISHKNQNNISPEYFSKEFSLSAKQITDNFKHITVNMTGGLDSRIIVAALLNNGARPQLVYGIGNSPLTNTLNNDLEINEYISHSFNLTLTKMNWNTSDSVDEYWKDSLEKYGELFTIYCGNRNVFTEYEKRLNFDYITFGYFGELMRNIEWIDKINRDYFTIDQFVQLYLRQNIPVNKDLKNALYCKVMNEYKNICKCENINTENIHKDEFAILNYYYRKSADTILCNLMNVFGYSTILLSEASLLELVLNIPYEMKMNARYMLQVIDNLYPKLLDVPFFSHRQRMVFDRKTFVLENRRMANIASKLKYYVNKSKYAPPLIKLYLRLFRTNRKYTKTKKYLSTFIQSSKHAIVCPKSHVGDVRPLARYTQLLYMNTILANNRNQNNNSVH